MDETLRMSTLGPYAARYSDKDIVVDGYVVPANTPIIHALGVSLKNETQWEDVYKCVTDTHARTHVHTHTHTHTHLYKYTTINTKRHTM